MNGKKDILGPLHKSSVKTDPNNFRGLAFSSCLGKLFNQCCDKDWRENVFKVI